MMDIYLGKTDLALSEAKKKGLRLKSLRGMALLSAKELSILFAMSMNTYNDLEVGRKAGLTEKWAKMIVECYRNIKIFCSVNWLLYGTGAPPYPQNFNALSDHYTERFNFDEKSVSTKLLNVYRESYPNATHYIVCDDGMLPNFVEGDLVAGRLKHGNEINNIIESICIVETPAGKTYLRKVRAGSSIGLYNLVCINNNTSLIHQFISDVELLSAAPVELHLKNEAH